MKRMSSLRSKRVPLGDKIGVQIPEHSQSGVWCSGPTFLTVTEATEGSNPFTPAIPFHTLPKGHHVS